jgi:hypothetical protein
MDGVQGGKEEGPRGQSQRGRSERGHVRGVEERSLRGGCGGAESKQ